jgi:hypothetical protein
MKTETLDLEMYAAMQTGKPVRTYKKTILGQVYCTILDPFNNEPKGILLYGDPKKGEESTMVDVWNDVQDLFFKRTNKRSLETGMIIEVARKEDSSILNPEPYATASDEEIDSILKQKYYTILSALNKCTNTTVLTRFLERARLLEKSEKIINTIISRISEIESASTED